MKQNFVLKVEGRKLANLQMVVTVYVEFDTKEHGVDGIGDAQHIAAQIARQTLLDESDCVSYIIIPDKDIDPDG